MQFCRCLGTFCSSVSQIFKKMALLSVFLVLTAVVLFAALRVDSESSPLQNDDTLVLLHVLFRHGSRTPASDALFPKDIYINETYAPYGYGELTTKGKLTEYEIGQYLRRTYNNFLPEQITSETVDALSTNFKRTKMSLQLVLASLFPPTESDRFSSLNWQPISFNQEVDGTLIQPTLYNCPNFLLGLIKYMMSAEATELQKPYQEMLAKLTEYTGRQMSVIDVALVHQTFVSQEEFGLKLAPWTAEFFPEPMASAARLFYDFSSATTGMKRLSSGFLIKKIIEDSLRLKNGYVPHGRKIFLYSAHDVNVASMLRLLNVGNLHLPPNGATLIFEIHNITNIYSIKVLYRDYAQASPKSLTIPGCELFCPLDKLIEIIHDYLPTETDVCKTVER